MSEKPVRLILDGHGEVCWLRVALNALPSREEQLRVVHDCFLRNMPSDERPNEMSVLLGVLLDLAIPDYDSFYKNGQPIQGKSATHFTCAQNLLFRRWLRENVYPILPPLLVPESWKDNQLIKSVACIEIRIDVLRHIIEGWSIERAEGEDREVYHTDAEECFWFICKAHAAFPAQEGDVLRGKIEDMIRRHLESGAKPIPGLLLGSWITRRGVPDGIARKMMHALVNLQPIEDSKSKFGL